MYDTIVPPCEPLALAQVRFLRSFQTGPATFQSHTILAVVTLIKRMLLVGHNPLFLEGLALLLRWRTGLSSVRAGSLAEAERVLDDAGGELACMVVDLDLPYGDGNELLERTNGLPALALTRRGGLERRAGALESGAAEVLRTKGPVEEIVAAVERLIGQAPARRASPAPLLAPIHPTS